MGIIGKEKIIDAFSKCIRITDEGYVQSDCEHCPNRANEWKDAACKDFDELSVEVPWQLAKDMLDLVHEQPEIIRCNDCKYLNAPANGVPFCKRIKKFVDADWFCADGERREK